MKRVILNVSDLKTNSGQYQDISYPYATPTSEEVALTGVLSLMGIRYTDVEWKTKTSIPYPSTEAPILTMHHAFGVVQGTSRIVSVTYTD